MTNQIKTQHTQIYSTTQLSLNASVELIVRGVCDIFVYLFDYFSGFWPFVLLGFFGFFSCDGGTYGFVKKGWNKKLQWNVS